MRVILAAICAIVLIVLITTNLTGNVVVEENPCDIVRCIVQYGNRPYAEFIGYDEQGLAVCKCPYETAERVYKISPTRKY